MILSHIEFEEPFKIETGVVNVLVIEKPSLMYKYVSELNGQLNGEEGNFILDNVKDFYMLTNYFASFINDKKVLNKLYQKLSELVTGDFVQEYAEIQSKICILFDKLNAESYVPLTYMAEALPTELFKSYCVKVEEDTKLLDRLISFVTIAATLLKIKCLFFVNLKSFLDGEELVKLYKAAELEEVALFLFENKCEEVLKGEKVRIIDKDLCEIAIERKDYV